MERSILSGGFSWNDPTANDQIQKKYPGAPTLVGWTTLQYSLGGSNS
jgi:hypothetical protein